MQVSPTTVVVKGDDDMPMTYDNPTVLMSDWGLWVKKDEEEDSTLTLFTWERVLRIAFEDAEAVKKVWEEAVLTVFEDLLEDMEYEGEDEEIPKDEAVTPPVEESTKSDDPTSNPYE